MKLLVTDIDSTLSVGETVSDEVISACHSLYDNGWQIMTATGRTLQSCLSHIRQISALDTTIVYDGARVMKTDGGGEVLGFEMPGEDVSEILRFTWSSDLEIQIAGDDFVYCRESDTQTRNFCETTGLECLIADSPDSVRSKVYRVAFWGSREAICSFELLLKDKFCERFHITRGGDNFLDVLRRGISKGYALGELIRGGHMAPELIAAAGDHMNDIELLSYADISAVPHDCAPEILKLADIIMPSVANDGFSFLAKILIDNF